MNSEQIRTLANHFCRMAKRYLKTAEELRGTYIVLERVEDGWDLKAIREKPNRRDYVTVIDLPEDIYNESLDDAIIDLAGIISRKLADSSRSINANLKRDKKIQSEKNRIAGQLSAKKRWGKS